MDVRSVYEQELEYDLDGSVEVWWLIRQEELRRETAGGFLDYFVAFAIPAGGTAELHSHPGLEFYYITHGRGVVRIEDEEREVMEGDLIKIEPNVPHGLAAAPSMTIRALAFSIGGLE